MKKKALTFFLQLIAIAALCQFEISAEWRPRTEFRDGYTTLSEPGENGVLLTTQRTRLNFGYTDPQGIKSYFSFMDTRTWGQNSIDATTSDLSLYQAWVNFPLTDKLTLKIGRQEFEYDDLKILSNNDWRVQGRSHDALLLQYQTNDSSFQMHAAGAVNNEEEVLSPQPFRVEGTYKHMQMLWLNKQLPKGEISGLLLNLGQQATDSVRNVNNFLTLGTYANYRIANLTLAGSFYVQTGSNTANQDVQATMASLCVEIPISSRLSITPGLDLLSGTPAEDQLNATSETSRSFVPLYARRHRYFGIQDMFYVGELNVESGLHDYYLKFEYKTPEKWRLRLQLHSFSTAELVVEEATGTIETDRFLGLETDFLVDYQAKKDLKISFGYAHFFATEPMEVLQQRGGKDEISQFAFLALSYTPTLFRN